MQHLNTLAIEITPETYSIAVACLPGGFATVPLDRIFTKEGSFLVINELVARVIKKKNPPAIIIENCWMTGTQFRKDWMVIGDYDSQRFFPVTRLDV